MEEISVVDWLDGYLCNGTWDSPEHAVTNLVTCGFREEAARDAIFERINEMSFRYPLSEIE